MRLHLGLQLFAEVLELALQELGSSLSIHSLMLRAIWVSSSTRRSAIW